MKMITFLSTVAMLAGVPVATLSVATGVGVAVVVKAQSSAEMRVSMRKLREDHIVNTRNYIISALGELPDGDSVAKRLLQNQDDIGNAIKPFYREKAGQNWRRC